jgi:hypothetical protein
MASIRGKVRELTGRRWVGLEVKIIVGWLNPTLRGWGNYFRWGNSGRKFAAIDGYVHERPALFASAKHGMRGRNWGTRFHSAIVTPHRRCLHATWMLSRR